MNDERDIAHSTNVRLLILETDELRVIVAPDAGGSIASFSRCWTARGARRELHWLRPATVSGLAARDPLAMASFPLVPFCNRIRGGRARFGGREIAMPPNHPGQHSPHPLHGIGWLRAWQVKSAAAASAELTLEAASTPAWPWRFSAWQRFALDAHGLSVTIGVRNEDTAAMPAGIGHHPYFPHHPSTMVTTATRAMWTADAEVMPVALEEHAAVHRLREGAVLAGLILDNNFTGWERNARIDWPADVLGPKRCLTLDAEAPLDYFVLYSPPGLDHFCAEPVSQCTDWLNLLGHTDRASLGGAVLQPGEALEASFTLRPQW